MQKVFYWYISVWELPHFAFNWPYKTKKQVILLILKTLNSYSHTKTDHCSHCIASKFDPKLVQLNGNINKLYTRSSRTWSSQNRSPCAERTFGLHCTLTSKKSISFMQSLTCLHFLRKFLQHFSCFPRELPKQNRILNDTDVKRDAVNRVISIVNFSWYSSLKAIHFCNCSR